MLPPAPPSPQKNHYRANAAGDFVDVKTSAVSAIGLDDTAGCSAAQIIVAGSLGKGTAASPVAKSTAWMSEGHGGPA